MGQKRFIIRYNELGLKGGNRDMFEKALLRHIKKRLRPLEAERVWKVRGRIFAEVPETNCEQAQTYLGEIPGIQNFSLGDECESQIEAIKALALEKFNQVHRGEESTFRVSAKRSDKKFPMKSAECEAIVGAHILENHPEKISVNLKHAAIDVQIEIMAGESLVFTEKIPGVGGLPVGSAGDVLCLLSGGIDSPVAAYHLIKRGCRVHFVFFENRVFLGRAAYEKVRRLAERLSEFQMSAKLHVIPFQDIQVAIRDHCREKNRVVLYRRFMYRLAERIARDHGYQALATGENLGQVASQTLENLDAVNRTVEHCVFRPLIGFDKQDIVKVAKNIKTYDISIEEAPDCCSVFMPGRPVTRSDPEQLEDDETRIESALLIDQTLSKMETHVLGSSS